MRTADVRRALASALLLLSACSQAAPSSGTGPDEGVVTRVVVGDTVEVEFDGREFDVRLIGIDTPETVKPGAPVECFGPEASAYTKDRLEGRTVRLEFDVERFDPFDRTLAYEWLGEELFNETLVREGYALVTTFPPNVRYVEHFRDAQRLARDQGLGLWSACP
jgi:micrococcal nuclease